jgi:hypothetical protein
VEATIENDRVRARERTQVPRRDVIQRRGESPGSLEGGRLVTGVRKRVRPESQLEWSDFAAEPGPRSEPARPFAR